MAPPSDIIQFECPVCLSMVRADKSQSGERVECPDCGQSLQVPETSTAAGAFDDLFDGPITLAPLDDDSEPGSNTPDSTNQVTTPPQPSTTDDAASTGSDDVVEVSAGDLVADEVDLSAGVEITEANPDELSGEDPFAIPEDLPPLQIDGITTAGAETDDVYGIKCEICDTRIHVQQSQAGTTIECPVCFSKITVPARPQPRSQKPAWHQPSQEPKTESDVSEDADSGDEIEIEEGYGLAPLDKDLLRPRELDLGPDVLGDPGTEDPAENLTGVENPFANDDLFDIEISPAAPPAREPQSESDAAESADKSQVAPAQESDPEQGVPQQRAGEHAAAGERKKSRRERLLEAEANQEPDEGIFNIGADVSDKLDFEPFTLRSLLERVKTSLLSPGTLVRLLICIALLGTGAVLYFQAHQIDQLAEKGEDLTNGQKAMWAILMLSFCGVWLVGTLGMLYVASMLFRDNALGKTHVESWWHGGWEDIQSTVLLFAFSFIIVGLPVGAFFGDMIGNPFRILVCPILLLFVWYNRSPFNWLAPAALKDVKDAPSDWQTFVGFIIITALVCLLGGTLYKVPWAPMSAIGAAVQCVSITAFATVTGWHVGRACARLQGLGPEPAPTESR